ncbi:DUF2970 domain-containing protein [Motilimonas pumila]|uniref:DUF2970 domain-containing protein n=1 Tax=Motilimonas pumila TaxID=2303987 RepID=A0A418YCW5_9GAMM|nr:DUF2970 domain-containing protein [Motilimonas pumila]RJG42346.1 DUF2970 domain-containing protein [Motilimonas pumila]
MNKDTGSGLVSSFKSACAALFGVQSEQNRKADFKRPSPWRFIFAGVIALMVFIGVLLVVVQWVLSH